MKKFEQAWAVKWPNRAKRLKTALCIGLLGRLSGAILPAALAVLLSMGCTAKKTTIDELQALAVQEESGAPKIDLVSEKPMEKTIFALDTSINIRLYDMQHEAILDEALELCRSYEEVFSAHKEGSELYRLNHRAKGVHRVEVSDELAEVIQKALKYCALSDGAFDITIEPVQMLWDFDAQIPKLPDAEEIAKERSKVDYRKVSVKGNTVSFSAEDVRIDLGAIAKGYIADRIKDYLIENGVESALINLGGNVLCVGQKPGGEDFKIGLQKPFAERRETIGSIRVHDLSVVSSGVYERHFILDGKNYHHILDPKTGYPYDHGIRQVSIISASSADADALSTTCFSVGVEHALEIVQAIPDTYAVFVLEDESLRFSEGAEELITFDGQ